MNNEKKKGKEKKREEKREKGYKNIEKPPKLPYGSIGKG